MSGGEALGPPLGEALGLALAALSRKERSVAEIGELLERKEVAPEVAEAAIEELVAEGTLDDERFARCFAEDKREISGWGPDRIREALARRGIGGAEIDAALAGSGHEEEVERAAALVAARGFDLSAERDRGRALGLLARRGFDSELAYDAVRRAERAA